VKTAVSPIVSVEWFDEKEHEEKRPNGGWKHWHLFEVVARKVTK
jgi:hypothetical protein